MKGRSGIPINPVTPGFGSNLFFGARGSFLTGDGLELDLRFFRRFL